MLTFNTPFIDRKFLIAASLLLAAIIPKPALAWGDEGHQVVALIADHYLKPEVRRKIHALLATDASGLTPTDIAHEATWADKYRDSDRNTTQLRYEQTRNWHFVDIELSDRDMDAACFGHPPLPDATLASAGPPMQCLVDKIDQFAAELHKPNLSTKERRLALQFLLHFVGDVHQPLHASDDHDRGGNSKFVTAADAKPGNLHHFWDTVFVQRLGSDPALIAKKLINKITPAQKLNWSSGSATDWAQDSFRAARFHTYGQLPLPAENDSYALSAHYVDDATTIVADQLSKAGVRLATMLNEGFKSASNR